MLSARELVLILRVQSAGANDLRRVRGELTALSRQGRNLRTVGGTIRSLGTSMTFFGGLATAGFALAASSAADFQHETMKVATQTGRTADDIVKNSETIGNIIQAQMQRFPASAQDMTDSLYDIYSSLDVSLRGGSRLLKLFNQEAVAGATDLTTVTQAGITVLNDFGGNAVTMKKRSNEMFAAVRFGRMTFDELSKSMNTLVPAFKQGHQSFETMISAMAFMTRRMPNTSMAATSLSRAIDILGRQKFVDNMKKAGVQITDTQGNLLKLDTVVQRIVKRFPNLTQGNVANFLKQMSGTEGTVQARRALTFLFHDLGSYQKMIKQIGGDNIEFSRSFKTMSQTATVQWAVVMNKVRVGVLQIGNAVLPVFMTLAGVIENAVDWLGRAGDAIGVNAAAWAAWAAVIVTVVGLFGMVFGGLAQMIGLLIQLRTMRATQAAADAVSTAATTANTAAETVNTAAIEANIVALEAQIAAMEESAAMKGIVSAEGVEVRAALAAEQAMLAEATAAEAAAMGPAAAAAGGFGLAAAGATVSIIALAAGAVYLADRTRVLSPELQEVQDRMTKFKSNMDTAAQSTSDLSDRVYDLKLAQETQKAAHKDVAKYREELQKAARGTEEYRSAAANLNAALRAQASATRMVNSAQQALNDTLKSASDHADTAAQHLQKAMGVVQGLQARSQNAAAAGIMAGRTPLSQILSSQAAQGGPAIAQAMKDSMGDVQTAMVEFNKAVNQGLNVNSAAAQTTLKQLAAIQAQYEGLDSAGTKALQNLSSMMGHVLTVNEQQLLGSLNDSQLAIAAVFGEIAHKTPTLKAINELQKDFGRLAPAAAALAAQTGKIPDKKQLRVLSNIPDSAIPDVVRLIAETGKIPSQKKIKVIIEHEQAVKKAQDRIRRLETMKIHVPELSGRVKVPKMDLNTSTMNNKIKQAKAHLQDLTKEAQKRRQSTIFLKSKPADAAAYGLQLGTDVKTGVQNGVGGLGEALSAKLGAELDIAIAGARAHIGAASPSKMTAELIGEPIMEGILMGVEHKAKAVKEALRSAMNDAISNMASLVQDKQDMLKDQFGEMFSSDTIQEVRDWGEKLTSADLFKDLTTRRSALLKFQRGISTLKRRGISFGLAEELRQLGPESQDAIDALTHMTGKELKKYSKLWGNTQTSINKMAVNQSKATLAHYRSQGANVALGFMRGMESMRPQLTRYFRRIFLSLFYQTQKTHKSHSPSMLYYNEGMNVAKGFRLGMDHGMKGAQLAPVGVRLSGRMYQSSRGTTHHTHYHINQAPNTSLMATLRRHDHVNRVRN